ncbi:MAG: hypothetical protein K6A34_06030 [Methanobrevibacter sp.]|nr:hypothetical protein [Methanobrevibacter sp.]
MKDNNNLLSYNQWSCGDYNGQGEFYNQGQLTNKHSAIGEYCIQAKRTSSNWWSDTLLSLPSIGFYTLTCKILNKSTDSAILRLLQDGAIIAEISVPVNESWVNVSLTGNFSSLTNNRIRLLNYGLDELFIDDMMLIKD